MEAYKELEVLLLDLLLVLRIASLLLTTIVRLLHIPADDIRLGAVILLIILGLSMVFPKTVGKIRKFSLKGTGKQSRYNNRETALEADF